MKTETYRSMGLDVKFQVPSSVEEFDQNAKRSGACLDEATMNVVYRGCLAEFREAFCEAVQQEHGIERKTKSVAKKDGTTVEAFDETENEFLERACAKLNIKPSDLQGLADKVAANIVFDASARERKAPSGKIAEAYLNSAKKLIDNGNADAFITSRLAPEGINVSLNGDSAEKNVLLLARGIKELQDKKFKAEREAQRAKESAALAELVP